MQPPTSSHSLYCYNHRFTDPSGVVYEGEFVDGQREGWGKYTNPGGKVAHEGYWKDNNPVPSVD